jgi:lipopolysaccharide cholinephosphotransferase
MEDYSEYNGEATTLRTAQLMMVDMLADFDRVCRENNLCYWIDYGTLLGAVRHKGFIPWDDDIDVSMPTRDYRKFLEMGQSSLKEGYFVQTEDTDPGCMMKVNAGLFKIRKTDTLFINDFDSFRSDYNKGLSIDVFENVEYPSVPYKFYKFFNNRVRKSYGFFHYNISLSFANVFKFLLFPVYYYFFKSLWLILTCMMSKERYYGTLEHAIDGRPSLISDMVPTADIEFEGRVFCGPANPSARLRDAFGNNFMQVPPKEKRKIHAKFICTDLYKCHNGL